MRAEKREWIYSGLRVPPNVALVRPNSGRVAPSRARLLLVGGAYAAGLAVPLSVLAKGSSNDFQANLRPEQSAYAWARFGWLAAALEAFRPTAALLALEPYDPASVMAIMSLCSRLGLPVLWLPPPGAQAAGDLQSVQAPLPVRPSAQYYASWAGSAWDAMS